MTIFWIILVGAVSLIPCIDLAYLISRIWNGSAGDFTWYICRPFRCFHLEMNLVSGFLVRLLEVAWIAAYIMCVVSYVA